MEPTIRVARVLSACALVTVILGSAQAVWAHSGFDPRSVKAGEVASLTLKLENEQANAGTVKLDLRFPEGQPLIVVAVPATAGWTATVQGGSVGSEATGIVWERASASPTEDPAVTMQLGPIPIGVDQLQFKVLQTYSNGEIDRWIQDWPAGSPEPEAPGPVLQVEANPAATTAAPTTSAPTTSAPTTAPPVTTPSPTTTAATDTDDDDSNTALVVAIVALVVLVAGAAATWAARRRRVTKR